MLAGGRDQPEPELHSGRRNPVEAQSGVARPPDHHQAPARGTTRVRRLMNHEPAFSVQITATQKTIIICVIVLIFILTGNWPV